MSDNYNFAGFLQKELVTDLLKECVKMQKFDHPNVLTLIGVCLDGGPAPYIVMPFMAKGSLLSYLKHEREKLTQESASEDTVSIAIIKEGIPASFVVIKGIGGQFTSNFFGRLYRWVL